MGSRTHHGLYIRAVHFHFVRASLSLSFSVFLCSAIIIIIIIIISEPASMVKLATYAAASAVGAGAVVLHAFHSRGQFYPAMLYLATSKISLVLLLNMALVLMCVFWQFLKFVFLGTLREAEVERLNEQSWRELMEILFAMTIFREEFNVPFVVMVTVLLFIKAFHWLAQKRVEYIETTPSVSRLSHFRIISFMALLFLLDSTFLYNSVSFLFKTKRPSVSLLFAFEYVILATSTMATFLKYTFYICDTYWEGQWENKAVFTFYLELVRDLLHLSLYLFFFLVIFINYGLPLHLVRELYETFRNFKARVADFIRYRKITSNMNDRFPDATIEELGRSDATCIICREEMVAAKKLPCGHLFHVHCLRSWLERQQTCPTCRSPVLAPEGGPAVTGGDGAAPIQPRQQQPPLLLQGMLPGNETVPQAHVMSNQESGATSSGSFYFLQQQARLQAAAAAAAQYNSSFVYPFLNGREICRHPTQMYLIPQAYLAAIPGLGLNTGGGASVEAGLRNSESGLTTEHVGTSIGQEGMQQSIQQVPLVMQSAFIIRPSNFHGTDRCLGLHENSVPCSPIRSEWVGVTEGYKSNDQHHSATALYNAATLASLESQQSQLQESIAILQHQLKRVVNLQNQLTLGNNLSHSPSTEEASSNALVVTDLKGKASACD